MGLAPRSGVLGSWQAVAAFWIAVVTLCLLVGSLCFFIGRRTLGPRLEQQASPVAHPWSAEPDGWFEDSSNPLPDEDKKPPPSTSEEEIAVTIELVGGEEDEEEEKDAASSAAPDTPLTRLIGDASPAADERPPSAADSEPAPSDAREPGGGRFEVRVGTFANEENSRRLSAELAGQGYDPHVTKHEQDGATLYRVSAGRYGSREEAEHVRDKLADEGHTAVIAEQ